MAVVLRKMQESDLPTVLAWRNAERVRMNMYTTHVISMEEHLSWWNHQSRNSGTHLLIAEIDSKAVGVVTFTRYTGPDGTATWAFYTGDQAPRGTGSQMEVAALRYAFNELKLRKLECEVLDYNMPVVNLHLRHGFLVEGIFQEAHQRDDGLHGIYRLALFSRIWFKNIEPMLRESEDSRFGLSGQIFRKHVTISDERVRAFVQATDDGNPVHMDDEAAKALGFQGRISHGMLTGSLFSAVFANEFPGPGTIYLSQSLSFTSPVPVGSEVEVCIRVLSHIGRKMLVETELHCAGKLCISGQAQLLAPKNITLAINTR